MNLVWNSLGVNIHVAVSADWNHTELHINGTGFKYIEKDIQLMHPRPFAWRATVTDQGWYVTIIGLSGERGSIQGATFNLPLEVATAANRLL